jgi:cytochrome c
MNDHLLEEKMNIKLTPTKLIGAIAAGAIGLLALSIPASSFAAVDAAAAETMVRQNGCFKCHAIDKKKDGPAYRDVAAKYRGKPDAEQRLITHITSGEKAKFPDGHEEEHKIIKTKDMNEIKNVVNWILSL